MEVYQEKSEFVDSSINCEVKSKKSGFIDFDLEKPAIRYLWAKLRGLFGGWNW